MIKFNNSITQEELKAQFNYDQETGLFTRIKVMSRFNTKSKVGDVANYVHNDGYITIVINRIGYRAHRLAWLYIHGEFPKEQIDHINRITTDNRIVNLREATMVENQRNQGIQKNNTSGILGVYWHKRHKRWIAKCIKHIGSYKTIEEATDAYNKVAKSIYGEFYTTS